MLPHEHLARHPAATIAPTPPVCWTPSCTSGSSTSKRYERGSASERAHTVSSSASGGTGGCL